MKGIRTEPIKIRKDYLTLPVHDLKPFEKNEKTHPEEQLIKIEKSIKEFGFTNPIIVDEEYNVLAGHGRLLVAKNRLKMTEVQCLAMTGLTDSQKTAYRLMDNRSAESEWDSELLKDTFTELNADGFELDLTGFDFDEIVDFTADDEGVSEVENREITKENNIPEEKEVKKIVTDIKVGDIIEIGKHKLMCADSLNESNVSEVCKDRQEKVNLLLTDPPYGIDVVNNGKVGISGKTGFVGVTGTVKAKEYEKIIGDDQPFDAGFLMNYGIHQIIFGANNFAKSLEDNSHWLVWDKKCGKAADDNNFSDCELAWTNIKAKRVKCYRHLWSGMVREGGRDEELIERVHPTQKPVGLMKEIIKDYSDKDGEVLDLFGGSGSTMVAAEKTGRSCYMMELSPNYCQVIVNRMRDLFPDLEIRCINREIEL